MTTTQFNALAVEHYAPEITVKEFEEIVANPKRLSDFLRGEEAPEFLKILINQEQKSLVARALATQNSLLFLYNTLDNKICHQLTKDHRDRIKLGTEWSKHPQDISTKEAFDEVVFLLRNFSAQELTTILIVGEGENTVFFVKSFESPVGITQHKFDTFFDLIAPLNQEQRLLVSLAPELPCQMALPIVNLLKEAKFALEAKLFGNDQLELTGKNTHHNLDSSF